MPDSRLPPQPNSSFDDLEPNAGDYTILRKGSVYNIQGPYGREFGKYKSASAVGPRWEELTHTPWPFESSAYQSGLRLWELGIIQREHVGLRRLLADSALEEDQIAPERDDTAESEGPLEKPPQATTDSTTTTDSDPPAPPNPYRPQVDTPLELKAPRAPKTPPPKREPRPDSKPRQQRLMFQENWDDHRASTKPKKSADAPESDTDSSESQ